MKNKTIPPQALKAHGQTLGQVIDRLASAQHRDRRIRAVKTALWGVAGGGAGVALGPFAADVSTIALAAGGAVVAAGAAALALGRRAPGLLDIARQADRHLAQDAAIETAVEGALKDAPATDLTPLLHAQVENATRGLRLAAFIPARMGWPVTAAVIGIGLAIGAGYLPQPVPTETAPALAAEEMADLQDSLAALAALRDSSDPALAALAREAEALATRLADDPSLTREEIAAAVEELQREAARLLGLDTDDLDTPDALARITALAEERAEAAPVPATELPDKTAEFEPQGQPDLKPEEQTIDAPENDLVTMPTRSVEDAIMDDELTCVFGDEPTCEVKADGAPPPAPTQQQEEDIPEQIGRDELTEGGDPAKASETSTGDAGATGNATSALYGTAELTEAGEAGFTADTLTLGADNPIGEGQRNQIDIPTTFEGVPATRFPDAPRIGQDGWRRMPEAPVARPTADTALDRAMTQYYLAPEDWR